VELSDEFAKMKQYDIEHYNEYVAGLNEDYAQIAANSWKSIKSQGYDWVIYKGKAYNTLEEFRDAVTAAALAKLPTISQIETGLSCDYRTAVVYTGADIARDNIQTLLEQEKGSLKIQKVRAKKAAVEEKAYADKVAMQLDLQEKRAKLDAMMEAEAQHAREQLNQLASPFEEVFTALRVQMAKDADEMLTSIQKNGFVRGKVAERGKGLLELFDLLAVQDDHELRAKLLDLKSSIGAVGDERTEDTPVRSTDAVIASLTSVKELAHQAAKDLAEQPSRFALLD
jgi:hypothetical protein